MTNLKKRAARCARFRSVRCHRGADRAGGGMPGAWRAIQGTAGTPGRIPEHKGQQARTERTAPWALPVTPRCRCVATPTSHIAYVNDIMSPTAPSTLGPAATIDVSRFFSCGIGTVTYVAEEAAMNDDDPPIGGR